MRISPCKEVENEVNNYCISPHEYRASLVAQSLKNLPAMQKTWVQSLSWGDPLEK